MKVIWDDSTQEELHKRLTRLHADTKPLWGNMNYGQMLAHCADCFRQMLREINLSPAPMLFYLRILKPAMIYWMPFPKGAPSAPELLVRTTNITNGVADIKNLLTQLAENETTFAWPDHPYFGKMSARAWGVFAYRHFDHHLRQFGV